MALFTSESVKGMRYESIFSHVKSFHDCNIKSYINYKKFEGRALAWAYWTFSGHSFFNIHLRAELAKNEMARTCAEALTWWGNRLTERRCIKGGGTRCRHGVMLQTLTHKISLPLFATSQCSLWRFPSTVIAPEIGPFARNAPGDHLQSCRNCLKPRSGNSQYSVPLEQVARSAPRAALW